MNSISKESNSINIKKKEIQKDAQEIYNETCQINHSSIEKHKNNNIQNIVHIFYPTSDKNNIKFNNGKKANDNMQFANIDITLLKSLDLNNDNNKFRETLSKLNFKLKQKEEALNETLQNFKKINEEYNELVKEFKKIEYQKKLEQEKNQKSIKMLDFANKNFNEYDKSMNQSQQLKIELLKNKEVINNLEGNYTSVDNNYNIIENNFKYKEILMNDLKIEEGKIDNMLKDRKLLTYIIEGYSKKIWELNEIIKQKDQTLKLMNFSKELNNEKKINKKEFPKQNIQNIKFLYNKMEDNKENLIKDNYVEIIKENKDKIFNNNNLSEIIFGSRNKNDKKFKCSFLIDEVIKNVQDIGFNYINKEFLIDNNFKTCLLKIELFSSIIREFEFYTFFGKLFSIINDSLSKFSSPEPEQENVIFGKYSKNISKIKIIFDKINKNALKYRKENIYLKEKIKDLILYITKLKKEFIDKIKKMKEKIKILDDNYNSYINSLKINNNLQKQENSLNEKKEEISYLHKEIDKIKNKNINLNQSFREKDEIINNLKNENEKLLFILNTFRANTNTEKNKKFYNSFSLNYNNNCQKENLTDFSNYENYKNSNKISNEYNFCLSFNDNFSNNNMKYPKKGISKCSIIKKKNIRNLNELIVEKDMLNRLLKSKSKITKFLNLKIENQSNYNYCSYNYPNNKNIIKSKMRINSMKSMIPNNKWKKNSNFNSLEKEEILYKIFPIIKDFKSEVNEEKFIGLTSKNLNILKTIQLLNNKIEEIRNNLSNIREKLKNNHKDKKIKSFQLIDIIDQVDKLLFYLNSHLNKTFNEMQTIHPYLRNIFDFVSKIVYDSPLDSINNSWDIIPTTIEINTQLNNLENDMKDIILTNSNNINSNNKKNINKENKDINNINDSIKSKKRLFENIKELKKLFDINKKIFSSSELIKYKNIYEGLSISKLLNLFKDKCQNLKNTTNNSQYEYDSDISDLEESNIIEEAKSSQILSGNSIYHVVNQKIFGLKRLEINYKIFMELIKNYLVSFEIIVNQIKIEINNNNRERQIKLREELNILYNIFEDAVYFKMDKLDDDIIFNRKILLKLLLNHKEYISIMFNILHFQN